VVVVFVGGHVCMQLTEDDFELKDDLFLVRSVLSKGELTWICMAGNKSFS